MTAAVGPHQTTYDSILGEKRVKWAEERTVHFTRTKDIPNFQGKKNQLIIVKMSKRGEPVVKGTVKWLPKHVTDKFFSDSLAKMGKECKYMLASTETGALFWNVMYHHNKDFKGAVEEVAKKA